MTNANANTATANLAGGTLFTTSVSAQADRDDFIEECRLKGWKLALQEVAVAKETANNKFFVAVCLTASAEGLMNIPAKDSGKFDGTNPAVKAYLDLIGERGSTRDYAGKVINLAWTATQAGKDFSAVASFADLKALAKPTKTETSTPESFAETARAEFAEEAKARAEAHANEMAARKAAQHQADALTLAQADAEQARNAAATAAGELEQLRAEIQALRAALETAQSEIQSLRSKRQRTA